MSQWASTNDFRISKSKTRCIHFHHLRKMHNDPRLKIDGTEIPVTDQFRFLGVVFDKKLTFIPHHLLYLKEKRHKALNLLRTT